jgi:hypothetical protein
MKKIKPTRVDTAGAPGDKSVWPFCLQLQRERDLAFERLEKLEQQDARQRAELAQQTVPVKTEFGELSAQERAEFAQRERWLRLRILALQGKPLADLQDRSLAELRQMLPDED